MEDHSPSANLSRRDFVTIISAFLGTIMAFAIGFPLIGYLISPALTSLTAKSSRISLGLLSNYSIGKPTLFTFTRAKINGWEKTVNSYAVFVLRHSENEMKVFSNICPHLSCRVLWHEDQQKFICPCHDAHFDQQGNVISGPPPRSLDILPHEIDPSGNLYIQMTEV
ncbi:MAG: ubiquinol-cytochrome c reductase iron-sulfur subunit [Chloroflexota bacterium]|jgi:menaquinol-cytochrome c reductase iron-sulfur subunit